MEKIKLVIWDLDETFWGGTLSEEGIIPNQRNINLVKELTKRGIINSIVSKNNFEEAKDALKKLNIWEFFVFPSIEWSPKGIAIKDVIEKCQLRDNNVLFIDDNHLNLEEAKFYNKNINVCYPDFIENILNHKSFIGKDDSDFSRLNQYKILEKKYIEKERFSDNLEFLKSSNIEIEFIPNVINYKPRVKELIERTNQLNFTKKRLNSVEVDELLSNKDLQSILIKVKDNYGDYGIVGFYSYDINKHKLEHFVFSCRILNLGIAQYVYSKLNFPYLDIIPEIAEMLDNSKPSWIKEKKDDIGVKKVAHTSANNSKKVKIFFKGGCDLDQMLFYLGGNSFEIESETNYVSDNNFPIHQDHSEVLIDSLELNKDKRKSIEERPYIPFVDKNFYSSKVFKLDYDCLVYSVLMDYSLEMYNHKELNVNLPYGGYFDKWTDEDNHSKIIENFKKRKIKGITKSVLNSFAKEFTHVGKITCEDFINNLTIIRNKIPEIIPIIFINGAEVESPNKLEKGFSNHFKMMNNALDRFISSNNNVYLLDMRKIITDSSQLTDNIRHYNRESYSIASENLLKILNKNLNSNIGKDVNKIRKLIAKSSFLNKVIRKLRKKL